MVHPTDMDELRRMVTNLYHDDKACIIRVLKGITALEQTISRLKIEIVEHVNAASRTAEDSKVDSSDPSEN